VAHLLLEHEDAAKQLSSTYKGQTEIQPVESITGGARGITGFGKAHHDSLMEQLGTAEYLSVLEPYLLHQRDSGATDHFELWEKVMRSKCHVVKKFMLGHVKSIPVRPIFTWLDAVRETWDTYAQLKLCWDPDKGEPSAAMRSFTVSKKFLQNARAGNFSKLDFVKDVYQEIRRQVRKATKDKTLVREPLLRSSEMRDRVGEYGDRLFSALGYNDADEEQRAQPDVEEAVGVTTLALGSMELATTPTANGVPVVSTGHPASRPTASTFSTVMDTLGTFITQGDCMEDEAEQYHLDLGRQFLEQSIQEAELEFKNFTNSGDPARPFPRQFLTPGSKSMLVLKEHSRNAELAVSVAGWHPGVTGRTGSSSKSRDTGDEQQLTRNKIASSTQI
jgi:hypothetical protein